MNMFQKLEQRTKAIGQAKLQFYYNKGLAVAEAWHHEVQTKARNNSQQRIWIPVCYYAVLWLLGARCRAYAFMAGFATGLSSALQAPNLVLTLTGIGTYIDFETAPPPPKGGLPLPTTESPAIGGAPSFGYPLATARAFQPPAPPSLHRHHRPWPVRGALRLCRQSRRKPP